MLFWKFGNSWFWMILIHVKALQLLRILFLKMDHCYVIWIFWAKTIFLKLKISRSCNSDCTFSWQWLIVIILLNGRKTTFFIMMTTSHNRSKSTSFMICWICLLWNFNAQIIVFRIIHWSYSSKIWYVFYTLDQSRWVKVNFPLFSIGKILLWKSKDWWVSKLLRGFESDNWW